MLESGRVVAQGRLDEALGAGATGLFEVIAAGDMVAAKKPAPDVYLLALERLAECRDPRKFGGWLVRIVRNRAFNHRRYLGIRAAEPLEHADAAPGASTPLDDAERSELRDRLNDAVGELPQTQREVLLLHDLEGWKHREIGESLGMPEGTVRYHLFNARRAVRGRLRALVGEED